MHAAREGLNAACCTKVLMSLCSGALQCECQFATNYGATTVLNFERHVTLLCLYQSSSRPRMLLCSRLTLPFELAAHGAAALHLRVMEVSARVAGCRSQRVAVASASQSFTGVPACHTCCTAINHMFAACRFSYAPWPGTHVCHTCQLAAQAACARHRRLMAALLRCVRGARLCRGVHLVSPMGAANGHEVERFLHYR
jgi:hypothetical protein